VVPVGMDLAYCLDEVQPIWISQWSQLELLCGTVSSRFGVDEGSSLLSVDSAQSVNDVVN